MFVSGRLCWTQTAACLPEIACSGVTLALACRPFAPDWRWQNA